MIPDDFTKLRFVELGAGPAKRLTPAEADAIFEVSFSLHDHTGARRPQLIWWEREPSYVQRTSNSA